MNLLAHEIGKYADIWSLSEYGDHSPGKGWSDLFHEIARPKAGQTVLDAGCGKGDASVVLRGMGLLVTGLDIVDVYDQHEFVLSEFLRQPLWRPIPGRYDYGYCCDVMEHLPEQYTMLAVHNLLQSCERVFFSISFLPDHFGNYIGEPLHLTVKRFSWWRDSLREIGTILDARDMLGEGVFYVSRA